MAAAAAPTLPPAVVDLLRLPLHPQHLPVVRQGPPHHHEREGGAVLPLIRCAGVVAATVPIDIAVTVVTKVETGEGRVQSGQATTKETAVVQGIAGAAEADQDLETGVKIGAEIVAAETERKTGTRKGKEAWSVGTAVTVKAPNTRRLPVKKGKGGERGAAATKKTRKRKIKTGKRSRTKRGISQKAKRRSERGIRRNPTL